MELEKLRANGGMEAAASGGATGAQLAEELAAARGRCAALEGDVAKWEAALAARDVELQNLQRALGEAGETIRGWGGMGGQAVWQPSSAATSDANAGTCGAVDLARVFVVWAHVASGEVSLWSGGGGNQIPKQQLGAGRHPPATGVLFRRRMQRRPKNACTRQPVLAFAQHLSFHNSFHRIIPCRRAVVRKRCCRAAAFGAACHAGGCRAVPGDALSPGAQPHLTGLPCGPCKGSCCQALQACRGAYYSRQLREGFAFPAGGGALAAQRPRQRQAAAHAAAGGGGGGRGGGSGGAAAAGGAARGRGGGAGGWVGGGNTVHEDKVAAA